MSDFKAKMHKIRLPLGARGPAYIFRLYLSAMILYWDVGAI